MRREHSYVQSHVGIPPGAERAFQLHILELRKQAWGIRRSIGSTVKRTGGDALRAPGLRAGGGGGGGLSQLLESASAQGPCSRGVAFLLPLLRFPLSLGVSMIGLQ